jgi:DNA-binding MarR family transcriptional regulator
MQNQKKLAIVTALLEESTKVHHRVKAVLEEIHQEGEFSAGKRAILRDLNRLGAQSVPQLARARPVSRQFIQKLVNEMAQKGYVEFSDNIAHKRSPLVKLTAEGKRHLEDMLAIEAKFLAEVAEIPVLTEKLNQTTETLTQIREWLEKLHLLVERSVKKGEKDDEQPG